MSLNRDCYLDDEAFKPYMKVLNELNVPVVAHHTPLPVYWQSVYEYTNLRRELGRIIDQATAVGPLELSISKSPAQSL